jgi:hypothetical protein
MWRMLDICVGNTTMQRMPSDDELTSSATIAPAQATVITEAA